MIRKIRTNDPETKSWIENRPHLDSVARDAIAQGQMITSTWSLTVPLKIREKVKNWRNIQSFNFIQRAPTRNDSPAVYARWRALTVTRENA